MRLDRLRFPDLPGRLRLLGFRPEDAAVVLGWREEVLASDADARRICELADAVAGDLGRFFDHGDDGTPFRPDDARHRLGRGVLPLFAYLASADDVHAAHAARGIPDAVSWATLADLGQQVWKDRQVNGGTGLHNQRWLRTVWAGRLVRLGRLQFELTRSDLGSDAVGDARPLVLSVHIPGDGPLTPGVVEASLRHAPPFFARHYPEAGEVRALVCRSWLLDPVLAALLPGSNLAAFGARWTRWACELRDRDALYFGFDIEPRPGWEPPAGVDALPVDSLLHRALVSHWRAGGHVRMCSGSMGIPAGRGDTFRN